MLISVTGDKTLATRMEMPEGIRPTRGRPRKYETAMDRQLAFRENHGLTKITVNIPTSVLSIFREYVKDMRANPRGAYEEWSLGHIKWQSGDESRFYYCDWEEGDCRAEVKCKRQSHLDDYGRRETLGWFEWKIIPTQGRIGRVGMVGDLARKEALSLAKAKSLCEAIFRIYRS